MAEGTTRRPLPALVALLALTLLTALVWWRVLNRNDTSTSSAKSCTPTTAAVVLPRPAAVSVIVLNSTNRTGIAKSTAKVLTTDGFKVVRSDNDTGHAPVTGVAEVRFTPDQKPSATLLTYYFPGAQLVTLSASSDSTLVVALGAKFTKVATTAAVQSAIQSARVSQAPAGSTTAPRQPSPTC